MLHARANGETFVSATMCPRLPGALEFAAHCNSTSKTYEKTISELPYVSTSKRVLVENLCYGKEFDLYENDLVQGTHYHMNSLVQRLI